MANEHYSMFINEAFIAPIRSVLIVDDDYPTFDEVLKAQALRNERRAIDNGKAWHRNPERIERVINRFRTQDRPLLVDIHDGANVDVGDEIKVATHLHQSDLLVLDFQLDKLNPGDGTQAINIVRSLMLNDHFNLVIVHTTENLDVVFDDFRVGLLAPSPDPLSRKEKGQALDLLESAEDTSGGFSERIRNSIDLEQYLHSRLHASSYLATMSKKQRPYVDFCDECENATNWTIEQKKLVLQYALRQRETPLRAKMNEASSADLLWSTGPVKWVKSDSVFIAFSDKHVEDDLLVELQRALDDWNPQPSRLFLAKLRAEMDERGVVAQGKALGNKHALAHWYDRLLKADGSERRWYVAESVDRHSEQLMSAILPHVEDFATRLIEAEVGFGEPDKVCRDHFNVDLTNDEKRRQAEREHNAFVCSKKPEGWHLTTGHIFVMNGHYWVCLSPACDTVPSQLSEESIKTFGERLPFIAVRLEPLPEAGKKPKVQTNRFVFLNLDGEVKGFCFNKLSAENSAPYRHTLYAEDRGKFLDGTFTFTVLHTEASKTSLVSKKYEATVVSQLRYEYALNLMQRLGISLTRIGLDFAG